MGARALSRTVRASLHAPSHEEQRQRLSPARRRNSQRRASGQRKVYRRPAERCHHVPLRIEQDRADNLAVLLGNNLCGGPHSGECCQRCSAGNSPSGWTSRRRIPGRPPGLRLRRRHDHRHAHLESVVRSLIRSRLIQPFEVRRSVFASFFQGLTIQFFLSYAFRC